MPIHRALLNAPENRHFVLFESATLRDALALLAAGERECQPWWHLVVERSDGTWYVVRLSELYAVARRETALLEIPLERLDTLRPARAFEQDDITPTKAQRLLRSPPRTALVILRQGRLAGILAPEAERGGQLPSRSEVRDVLAGYSPPPSLRPIQAVPRVRRYTDVSCPRRVAMGADRFSAIVRLLVDSSALDLSSRPLDLAPDLPIKVRLDAPGFDPLDGDVREIRVLPDTDSPPVVFDLRPQATGRHDVSFDFLQGGQFLGTVRFGVETVREVVATANVGATLDLPPVAPGTPPPDRVLRITWNENERELRFTLISEGGAAWQDFPAVRLKRDPAADAETLFETLKSLTRGLDPTAAAAMRGGTGLGPGEVQTEIKKLGQNLWRRLLPGELRALYARERQTWQRTSLMILSDEPFLPWELVWPYGADWDDGEPWCLSLRLTRWLRRDEQGEGSPGAPGRLPVHSLVCVGWEDPALPAIRTEQERVKKLALRRGVLDLSPTDGSLKAVIEVLERLDYDWLHVATHGSFNGESPDQHSTLWLEGGHRALTPQHFVGQEITNHLGRKRPGFFFNVCHGARLGWSLTGMGGWAHRLVSLGAGLFLAPMWTVSDEAAWKLADKFYAHLDGGETVAEALRLARKSLPDSDPSRLAYSLYGHPNARVEIG